ncbi:hypothetical protein GOHSU_16_01530 [Gordonia hirsuta DSM 44140 = NBRC 16056]|uniref:KANL3/Tex30 alpha/beta hydrolase-like domain-containing protein n=1 Tax=Gordonia hirsuta DSM 44140 = NBRC 16056 TaxID=1121927 RepID=L7L7R3_9ACTN|nr:alpha/beta family hydrolase [Gordonia hirsuta]GAC57195.1 hypothetical protein GOHSU_16_01530 [Gordonia hirsuta DSM 44140 = NBRC 16056]
MNDDVPATNDDAPAPVHTESIRADGVVAQLDRPAVGASRALVLLAHGAGSDRNSVLLRTLSAGMTARGLTVARIDLPYRQQRPTGPPSPSKADADRAGIAAAIAVLAPLAPGGPLIVGGQSYGGRQASMLLAQDPGLADGLLLTSYPLHPPGKPEKLRVAHLGQVVTPTLIIHGRSDAFATVDEIAEAATLFAGPVEVIHIDRADHGLRPERSGVGALTAAAVDEFFLGGTR